MRVRYTTSKNGRPIKKAEIYTREEHGIRRQDIDADAFKVVKRLRFFGHTAYIVGGAVRDLLLGKQPKDFDIATDASPSKIRRLFRNSRVIGKRFRLVHIFFQKNKIIEVSTFRAKDSEGFKNVYGGVEEDVFRRDFTLNALYYCPVDGLLFDYVGGVRDIRAKRLRQVIPIPEIFEEDPVRMIRAMKYATTAGFNIVAPLRRQLKRSKNALQECSASRLTEELFKILLSGSSRPIVAELKKHEMLGYLVPQLNDLLDQRSLSEYRAAFFRRLEELDELKREKGELSRSDAIAFLCADYLFAVSDIAQADRVPFREAFGELKQFIRPVSPANKEVEEAVTALLRKRKHFLSSGSLLSVEAAQKR